MRILTRLTLLVALVALTSGIGFANPDPGPPWETCYYEQGAYDVTVDWAVDPDNSGWYKYQWDVTFNGFSGFPPEQLWHIFVVYDSGGAQVMMVEDAIGEWDSDGADETWEARPFGGNEVIEWIAKTSSDRLGIGSEVIDFTAWFDKALTEGGAYPYTAIKVQEGGEGEDSEWIRNTPEPATWCLLVLSGIVGGALKRRRNKED